MSYKMRITTLNDKPALSIIGKSASPLMTLKLYEHDIEKDKFVILAEKLFKVVKANIEILSAEEVIEESFTKWNQLLENEVFYKNGHFYIEVTDSLSLLADNTKDYSTRLLSIQKRFVCIFDEDSNIVSLRENDFGFNADKVIKNIA